MKTNSVLFLVKNSISFLNVEYTLLFSVSTYPTKFLQCYYFDFQIDNLKN